MTEKEYNKALALLGATKCLSDHTAQQFIAIVEKMEEMLNETDMDDYFGTEGWKHRLFDE